jgi:hypothetical protein
MSKYGNTHVNYQGKSFDSKLERDYYLILLALSKANAIQDLKCQVRYPLHGLDGKKVCDYIPDFEYHDKATGHTVVVDTKGVKTAIYMLKKKLFLSEHKHDKYGRKIEFQELNRQDVNRAIKYGSKLR